ncbi:hypothetical protein ACFWMQ_00690 [Streptomyces sp. NPDC058372]
MEKKVLVKSLIETLTDVSVRSATFSYPEVGLLTAFDGRLGRRAR